MVNSLSLGLSGPILNLSCLLKDTLFWICFLVDSSGFFSFLFALRIHRPAASGIRRFLWEICGCHQGPCVWGVTFLLLLSRKSLSFNSWIMGISVGLEFILPKVCWSPRMPIFTPFICRSSSKVSYHVFYLWSSHKVHTAHLMVSHIPLGSIQTSLVFFSSWSIDFIISIVLFSGLLFLLPAHICLWIPSMVFFISVIVLFRNRINIWFFFKDFYLINISVMFIHIIFFLTFSIILSPRVRQLLPTLLFGRHTTRFSQEEFLLFIFF